MFVFLKDDENVCIHFLFPRERPTYIHIYSTPSPNTHTQNQFKKKKIEKKRNNNNNRVVHVVAVWACTSHWNYSIYLFRRFVLYIIDNIYLVSSHTIGSSCFLFHFFVSFLTKMFRVHPRALPTDCSSTNENSEQKTKKK